MGGLPDRELTGIDWNDAAQLDLLAQLRYPDELSAIPQHAPAEPGLPYYDQDHFRAGDAEILYSLLRHLRPRRMVEIGSGMSTRFAAAAFRRLREDDPGYRPEHVCIEPYRAEALADLDVEVIVRRVEELDLDWFSRLEAGDVLFIDSSHVIRPGGDVLREHLEIVPRLADGVVVHVHDIFTPDHYPLEWLRQRRLWNEQYLVEALLTHSAKLRILLALRYLHQSYPRELQAACPVLARSPEAYVPGSLWLQVAPG